METLIIHSHELKMICMTAAKFATIFLFQGATDSGIATSGDPSPVLEVERRERQREPEVREVYLQFE